MPTKPKSKKADKLDILKRIGEGHVLNVEVEYDFVNVMVNNDTVFSAWLHADEKTKSLKRLDAIEDALMKVRSFLESYEG